MAHVKIGFVIDSINVSKDTYDLVRQCADDPALEASCLILQKPRAAEGRPCMAIEQAGKSRASWVSRFIFNALTRFERLLLRFYKPQGSPFSEFDLTTLVSHTVEVFPEATYDGDACTYSDHEAGKVMALGLDVLVYCGRPVLLGALATAATHGVIAGQHRAGTSTHPSSSGFQEAYASEDHTEFLILHPSRAGAGAQVLRRGSIATKYFYLLNQAELIERQSLHLYLVLRHLVVNGALPAASPPAQSPVAASGNSPKSPTTRRLLHYSVRLGSRLASRCVDYLLGRRYRWNVAFCKGGWKNLDMSLATVIGNPKGRFLADPFLVSRDGRDYCFVEDYDEQARKGAISAYEITGGKVTRLGEVLNEPFHMSFPFLFEYEGQLYMCPETSEANEIRVYKSVEFPLKWELAKILMAKTSAVDTVIFPQAGCWWMLTGIRLGEIGDFGSEMFAFSAASPLSDRWTAHRGNPLVSDANGGRNAGFLRDGDIVYRPGQCQGFDLYGKSIVINRIDTLDADTYEEVAIAKVVPPLFDGIKGAHHIHSNGHLTVFDFVRKSRHQGASADLFRRP